MSIRGSVTITIREDGTHHLEPQTGVLDRTIQVMQWSLNAPKGYKFAEPPIVFYYPPPAGYTEWVGDPPVRLNDWQVNANARMVLGDEAPVKYRYDIFYVDHQNQRHKIGEGSQPVKIDPDMENMPQP